jgi:serine phosphatase RsbU (regulator of sigma subunit)
MRKAELPPLHRLIRREQAQTLLEAYTASLPGSSLALVRPDGSRLASAGEWPEIPTAELAAALERSAGQPVLETAHFTLAPVRLGSLVVGGLAARGPGQPLQALQRSLELLLDQALELREMGHETLERYRELNLLYHVGETIGACLDPAQIPSLMLADAREVLRAGLGAVLLSGGDPAAGLQLKASFGLEVQVRSLQEAAGELVARVFATGLPDLLDDLPPGKFQLEEQAAGALPVAIALCAPLKTQDRVMGVLLLGRHQGAPTFTAGDEKLATALAGQAAIALEKAWLHQQELQRQRLEEELAIGRQIQLSLLPSGCPEAPGWEFAAYYQAARQVGGDFYDFISLPGESGGLGLVIADVTGKGVPAALMMAFTRAVLHAEAPNSSSPAEVLNRANQVIYADNRAQLFLSAFYGVLEPGSGQLTYANGGHERPLWLQASSRTLQELAAPGMLLGAFQTIELGERRIQLAPGDLVVFFTDGVTEARNNNGELFDETRLRAGLLECAGVGASEVLQDILQAVQEFVGDTPQADDFTLVVIRREPEV